MCGKVIDRLHSLQAASQIIRSKIEPMHEDAGIGQCACIVFFEQRVIERGERVESLNGVPSAGKSKCKVRADETGCAGDEIFML